MSLGWVEEEIEPGSFMGRLSDSSARREVLSGGVRMTNKVITVGVATFFGVLSLGIVVKLGAETLAVVVGVLLGVMGVVPLGLLMLAAASAGKESSRSQQPPVVIVAPGTNALPQGNLYDPYRQIPQPTMFPTPPGSRQFHLIGGAEGDEDAR